MEWAKLSQEERELVTEDGVDKLKEHHEMKALATWTVPIDIFHDARQTLQALKTEVCTLLVALLVDINYYVSIDTHFVCMHWH